jgi:predicted amidohydrolase
MESRFRTAVAQTKTADTVGENRRILQDAVDAAADGGAGLLVVPECALSGYLPPADLDFDELRDAELQLVEAAAERDLWFVLGTSRQTGGRLLNTARLYAPGGEPVLEYDKTQLTTGDAEVFVPGAELPVVRAGEWTVGLQICFDMRFPENWRILRRKGAELVLHIANASKSAPWKVPVLAGAVRTRAAENGMYVVSANDAREPQMMVSAVYDPDGVALAEAAENEATVIFADLDRSRVKSDFIEARRTDLWAQPENRRMLLE